MGSSLGSVIKPRDISLGFITGLRIDPRLGPMLDPGPPSPIAICVIVHLPMPWAGQEYAHAMGRAGL